VEKLRTGIPVFMQPAIVAGSAEGIGTNAASLRRRGMRIGEAARKTLLGAAASAVVATAAGAADIPPMPAPQETTMLAQPTAERFAWAGPYIGGFGLAYFPLTAGLFGFEAGWNVVRFHLIYGAEVETGLWLPAVGFAAQIKGRVGVLLGNRFQGFAALGTGVSGGGLFWSYGGGITVGLNDSWTATLEAQQWRSFSGGPGSPVLISLGLDWYPGNGPEPPVIPGTGDKARPSS
jgi:hypothetical protein